MRRGLGWTLVALGSPAALVAAFLLVMTVRGADPGCWTGAPSCAGLGKDLFTAGWQVGSGAGAVALLCLGVAWLLLRSRPRAA